ncbi:MAG TPA: hypothetical protein DDX05_04635 [Deltaproteobacteria bacterium]|nr:hypothetical protein [Deltaproteobacteria bacterium]
MLQEPTVMLDNLVLSLSDSLDLIHPSAADHQQRVAYIALRIAKAMGHHPAQQADLMYASVLHDIGLLSVEEKIQSMTMESKDEGRHAEIGCDLLRRFSSFVKASQIVRIHHRSWSDEPRQPETDDIVRVLANMLSLADHVDRAVNRGTGILVQAKAVVEGVSQSAGKEFSPGIVQCFRELAAEESFWLDFASPRIYSVLSGMVQWPRVELDLHAMEEIAKIFCRIVDFRSRFTSTHTAGVAAVARGLAQMMCFSGKGYPFHVRGEDIPLGSRIMCVADVFTAVTENRPYRKGTGRNETLPILQNMARSGALDDHIVRVLAENYDEIDGMRSDVQEISASEYSDFVSKKTGAIPSPVASRA